MMQRPCLALLIATVLGASFPLVSAAASRDPTRWSESTPIATQAPGADPQRAQPRRERRANAANRTRAEDRRRSNPIRSAAPAAANVAIAANPASRLQLEPPEPVLSEEAQAIERAITVVARAASAARAAASAASQAQGRIHSLERTVGDLRVETQGQRELSEQLRGKLARQDNASAWVWPLAAGVLLLAGLAFWLARRLVVVQREYQARWLSVTSAGALPPAVAPASPQATPVLTLSGGAPRQPGSATKLTAEASAWPAAPPTQPWDDAAMQPTQPMASPPAASEFIPDSVMPRTQLLPPPARVDVDEAAAAPRDVSIEELIDLEQQAEFFVVLGQDDAAIELLSEHLRNTGGSSPLPYLKLLEIFHRRGDRADYERSRTRFNHRFNAYAPEWGSDLGAGRSLEAYAGILPRLQQAWPRPLDAMAEMEALLFRKSRGDLFDLPAYRELLFLYSLARDLLDREGADTGTVDLLLPLSAPGDRGGDFGSTAPAPYLGLESNGDEDRGERGHGGDDRQTLPLDFDLSAEAERKTSIFDPPDRHGRPSKRH